MNKYKNIKIGIIGSGYWATNIIKTLEDSKIKNVFVFDSDYKQLLNTKNKFQFIKIVNSLNDLLKLDLECYFLVTPSSTHYKIAKKIILRSKDLFVEKPVGLNSKGVKELLRLSNIRRTIFMTGYIYNYNVYLKFIKKYIQSKKLGKIRYIYFERSNLGPIRNDASCLWDLAAHDISSSIFLLNENPKVISSYSYDFLKKDIFDISSVHLKSKSIDIEIKSSWLNPKKSRKIVILGEKKMLSFDELDLKNNVKIYNQYAKYPKTNKFKKSFFTPKANIFIGKTYSPKIKFKAPLKEEIFHFLECVKNRTKPLTDGKYAFQVSKIIEKIENKII
jgi:predicted dehydrogenase